MRDKKWGIGGNDYWLLITLLLAFQLISSLCFRLVFFVVQLPVALVSALLTKSL